MTMPNFCINFLNKAAKLLPILYDFTVASLMDAWIKIMPPCLLAKLYAVASLADAWIKIFPTKDFNGEELSHPSRMRGLKLKQEENQILTGHIASLVDAWIKIMLLLN